MSSEPSARRIGLKVFQEIPGAPHGSESVTFDNVNTAFLKRLGAAIYDAANSDEKDPNSPAGQALADGNTYLKKYTHDLDTTFADWQTEFHKSHYDATHATKNVWRPSIPAAIDTSVTGSALDEYKLLLGFVTIMGCRF